MALDEKIYQLRRDKLAQIEALGQPAYPHKFTTTHAIPQIVAEYSAKTAAELEANKVEVRIAGRLMGIRLMGKAAFAHLQQAGQRLQVYVKKDAVGDKGWELFKLLDIGDHAGIRGYLFRTRTGELTVHVDEITFLAKDLLPLPEKWHGLTDVETRYRQRYVDLVMNPEVREVFVKRSKVVQALRRFFDARGYVEVETPMMHPIAGGAVARPFTTHHNTLDIDLFLRIAPELYLKRLIVGGLERVYEINRNFRNEGISTQHNPEFTMMEFYEAYRDYRYLMDFTEELLRELAQKVLGTLKLPYGEHMIDIGAPFDRLTIAEAIQRHHPEFTPEQLADRDWLLSRIAGSGFGLQHGDVDASDRARKESMGVGSLQLALFEETTEQKLVQPTFIVDYPAEVSPLARRNDAHPELTDRFELYIAGREMANGFSELNDPEDQAERFEQQAKAKAAGDEEAMYYDADYIRALEYGMPPAAGEGIGIDRLAMLFTDSPSIRDVILFPQMRPEAS